MDQPLSNEVWRRMMRGESLAGLGLGLHDGRLDLRGLIAPTPMIVREFATPFAQVREFGNVLELQNVRCVSFDFSGSRLDSLRIFHSTFDHCRFDGASCQGWRMWGTT